jgi:hypothetical protein
LKIFLLPASVALICAALCCCASFPSAPADALTPTELQRSLSAHDGKSVLLKGFMQYEFENHSLWLAKSSSDELIQKDCIGLSTAGEVKFNQFHNKYVVVRGVVRQLPANTIYLNACASSYLELSKDEPPVLSSP